MDFPIVTPATIAGHAREMFKKDTGHANKTMKKLDEEMCKSLIGTTYDAASEAWNLINPSETAALQGAKPEHLLWTLLFLSCHCTMPILARVVGGVDEETCRFWVFLFVEALAGMKPRVASGNLIPMSSRLFPCSHAIVLLL
jgi:hypothetical protein